MCHLFIQLILSDHLFAMARSIRQKSGPSNARLKSVDFSPKDDRGLGMFCYLFLVIYFVIKL